MIGLEKVIGKILADAEADARETLAVAEADCAAITARYRAETEAELERLREASDKECQGIILRAKSSAGMAKRDAILEARAAILDEAYATAEREIRDMSGDAYLDLLSKMLRTALRDRLEAERDSMQLYGEDISPAAYEVLLSDRDRGTYGTRLLRSFKTGLGAKFPAEALDKLTLAPDGDGSHIDGGLILRCGAVETNCTLSMLLAQNRRETEARVNQILFGDET